MSDWMKTHITIEGIMKFATVIISLVVFAAVMRSDIDTNKAAIDSHLEEYKQYRQEVVPNTYMRKDVMDQVFIRLERIERKIDNMNK